MSKHNSTERASRVRTISRKKNALNNEGENTELDYQADGEEEGYSLR